MTIEIPAPAKVNLALHVVGRRPDGYHLLDSIVAFASAGDRIRVEPAEDLSLSVEGPFASALAGEADNLVLRAARLLQAELIDLERPAPGARIVLDKSLPVASGIGGGSADAAATLVALDRLWHADFGTERLARLGGRLGADVPMCVIGRAARVGGIGEVVEPLGPLPAFDLVLVNPGRPLATPDVFQLLERRDNPPLPAPPSRFETLDTLVGYLASARNDLTDAARRLVPEIGSVLDRLAADPACRLARMSGSGATCYALADPGRGAGIAERVGGAEPGWWVSAG
ncbi:4-(cytidine 5'-diphospho)-2-C-methyl-D-erythritol kinase [Prosthecomicrobium sp. N25]|uniref:4-(cytidine 5'-diphospho)-2-C-methyl-D-erythritol kinase n=1 Tax=Prosthecomicrobium sp. N25 TaxID=3129254 RepID=UPI0030775FCE